MCDWNKQLTELLLILVLMTSNTYWDCTCVDAVKFSCLLSQPIKQHRRLRWDELFCFLLFRYFKQADPSFFVVFLREGLLFYLAKTAGFRLWSLSYKVYFILHTQPSRLRRDRGRSLFFSYLRLNDFTLVNALSKYLRILKCDGERNEGNPFFHGTLTCI